MSQAQTLQDIYLKIADIQDNLCTTSGGPETWLVGNVGSLDNSFTPSSLISLSNLNANADITKAQTEINELITAALVIARDGQLSSDFSAMSSTGTLIPIPKNSPIALLPKLLEALLLYKAPLRFLSNLIIEIFQDALFEHIKRKLNRKTGSYTGMETILVSKILTIPKAARQITFKFSNIPSYVSKRFELEDSSKSIVKGSAEEPPDLSKYIDIGLATVSYGRGLSGQLLIKNIFWHSDIKIEFANQIVAIPELGIDNLDSYAYIHLNHSCSCEVGYFS